MARLDIISVVATFIPGCIAFLIGIIFIVRMRREKVRDLFLPRNKSLIGFGMLSVGFVLYSPIHPDIVTRVIAISAVHIGGLIVCVSTQEILVPNLSLVSRKITLVIIVMSILTNILDVMRGGNDGLFLKGETFDPTVIYVFYCCFLLSTITLICLVLARIHWFALSEYKSIAIRMRMNAMVVFHGINMFNSILAQINLLLYCFGMHFFFIEVNIAFYLLLDLNFILILCVFLPDRLFLRIAKPAVNLLEKTEERKQSQLRVLHNMLVQIVPIVQLPGGRFSEERLFVEISHARRIIWSHGALPKNMSIKEEARYIYHISREKKVFDDAGSFPPPPKLSMPQKYYEDLACLLDKEISSFMNGEIPSIPGFPFIGNLWDFLFRRLSLLERISRECGDIGTTRIGPDTIVLVNNPDYIHEVLVDYGYNGVKPRSVRDSFRPAIGESLLVIEGSLHRERRKLLAPHFQYRNIVFFSETIVGCVESLQSLWKDQDTLDVGEEMLRLTLNIVGKTFFGVDINNEAQKLRYSLEVASRYVNDYLSLPLRVPTSWPLPRNRQYRAAISSINHFIDHMIAYRQRGGQGSDMLSVLLNVRDSDTSIGLSTEEARQEILSLFMGGNDTTRHALVWMWYLLGQNPEVLQKLQHEIDTVLQGRMLQFSDLSNMPYSIKVIKESLRMYSPVYIIVRSATRPVTIGGKYQVPAGHHFVVTPYVLHRRTDYYPEPERFNPDRFDQSQELPRYAYLPFGIGPHTCIGNHFAMLVLQITLITIAQHITLKLEPDQNIKPLTLTTLQPDRPVYMRVQRRA